MARGGGTGSRNKKKKSAEAPATQNGSMENQKSSAENGGGDTKQNKNTKHRKQKEETPPVIPPEDDQKDSQSSKLVPTSEQLRLAQITQSADTNMDPQRKAKISQVMDITGKSEDEVATALFDCGWDETKAIELLLEEGGLGSWETTGQKKKKKADKEDTGKENEDWNEEFDPNNQFSDNRERSRNRGPPRLRNRGGSSAQGARDGDQWKNREFQENERNFEGGRGRGGRGMGPRSRGGGQGGMPPRQRGRGGGTRGFNNRGEFGERGERADRPAGEGGLGQIDTWNPIGQEQDQRQRHHKMQNKDAFDNAGNWGDDFPTAEDWDNDEYTGSLSDTKVFTPSGSSAKAVGEPVNGSVAHPAVGSGGAIGPAQPSPANNSLGSSYSQPIDLSTLLKPGGLAAPSAAPGGPTGHSQYNQTATQDLKSAIGIGAKPGEQLAPGYGGSSLSYSSGTAGASPYTSTSSHQPSSFSSPAPGSAFSPIKPAAVTNGSSASSKALPRARLPPPSKIPSSAVEMPGAGDSLSNLDVQFGGLDLQFGGSNNDSNSTNFEFNAAPGPGVSSTPPGPSKDSLDSKYVHSIQTGTKSDAPPLDSYKAPGQPPHAPSAVKDVNQSLSSALSAAGIKPSSSTDSVPGYGRDGPARPDSKSNPGYGVPGSSQRSPGPLITKTETLGYTSPAYSYQSSNSSSQPKSGNNFTNYPNQSYERQNSSGYSSSNGLSSSYGGNAGASSANASSYNSGTPSNSSGYSGNNGSYPNSQNSSSNFNSGYGTATTNYSPYTSNNSYSSKTGAPSSTSYIPTSSTPASLAQYSNSQDSSISTSTSKSAYDTATVSAPGYGNVATTGLGLSSSMVGGAQTVSSASKMSVNTTSGKMVPGMPPGVANVLPAQYMIGANAAAGFPAYLAAAGLGQAPAMYGYGGHQLEDLAALQRSTLAASLPQLVGSASGQGGNNPATAKGPSTGYYDPSSQFGGAGVPSTLPSRQDQQSSFGGDTSKFGGGVSDSTSSPVPTSVANAGQPTPFNALASTFAAAAPQQHPTLPPGYAYFYGGVGGMPGALQAYGGGVGGGVYPATHPGIPVPTAAGATNTSQFQNKPYASSYGTSYDSLNLGQSNSGYGKNNYGSDNPQPKSGTSSSNAGTGYWSNALW